MTERPRNEKDEKDQGGRGEKDEKDQGGWDEKWRRDPIDAAMWAIILIWVGVVLLGSSMNWFDDMSLEPWAIGFLGAGAIVLLVVFFRLLVPAYRKPLTGSIILGIVFIGIGLGSIIGWYIIGPLVIIAVGVGILFTGLFRRRGPDE